MKFCKIFKQPLICYRKRLSKDDKWFQLNCAKKGQSIAEVRNFSLEITIVSTELVLNHILHDLSQALAEGSYISDANEMVLEDSSELFD